MGSPGLLFGRAGRPLPVCGLCWLEYPRGAYASTNVRRYASARLRRGERARGCPPTWPVRLGRVVDRAGQRAVSCLLGG